MNIIRTPSLLSSLLIIIIFAGFIPVHAQQTGTVKGTVLVQKTGASLPSVNVAIENTTIGVATDAEGRFVLNSVPIGNQTVVFSFVGYQKKTKDLTVNPGQTVQLSVALQPKQIILEGISVTALRPDLEVNAKMKQADVRKANPRDSGELLRNVDGVSAVRRGPVGLDPVVRGLRETEVGTYLDGTRIFPGGAARMDSPLSHLDPSMIETIEVVKVSLCIDLGSR